MPISPVSVAHPADDQRRTAVADVLRRLALDEDLKAKVAHDPALNALAWRVARRYVPGQTLPEALGRAEAANRLGHTATVEFMGESVRDRDVADAATDEFLSIPIAIRERGLRCSLSLDLSHIGSVVDRELGRANARRIAEATAAAGIEMIISMEGHDRTSQILEDHLELCQRFDHVGVTIQARLHRTADDIVALLQRPGRIRLVKGAFDTPAELALAREDPGLLHRFDSYTDMLLRSGHPCSIATHDIDRLDHLDRLIDREGLHDRPFQVEMLTGLGGGELERQRELGRPTQEYIVYGTEWWLYVCNRLAEDPQRLFDAVVDLMSAED